MAKAKRERNIFHYFDGTRDVFGDPYVIWNKLAKAEKDSGSTILSLLNQASELNAEKNEDFIDGLTKLAKSMQDEGKTIEEIDLAIKDAGHNQELKLRLGEAANERLCAVTRAGFDIPPFQDGGLTVGELSDLMSAWFEFISKKKPSGETKAPCSPSMDTPRTTKRLSKAGSASGSIGKGPGA